MLESLVKRRGFLRFGAVSSGAASLFFNEKFAKQRKARGGIRVMPLPALRFLRFIAHVALYFSSPDRSYCHHEIR
jgi:hypothetical protein